MHTIHLALQIVPLTSQEHPYKVIDKAIELIAQSGLRYQVGPMETVIEGKYDDVMALAKQAQYICLQAGASEIVVTMKLHIRKDADITWEEKMNRYTEK